MFETGVALVNECYNHSARSGTIIRINFRFSFNMKVCCVFSLESPHGGDSNESTQYKKENRPKLSQLCSFGLFPKGLKNEFKTAMVNEPSVFEPLKVFCIYMCMRIFVTIKHIKKKFRFMTS